MCVYYYEGENIITLKHIIIIVNETTSAAMRKIKTWRRLLVVGDLLSKICVDDVLLYMMMMMTRVCVDCRCLCRCVGAEGFL